MSFVKEDPRLERIRAIARRHRTDAFNTNSVLKYLRGSGDGGGVGRFNKLHSYTDAQLDAAFVDFNNEAYKPRLPDKIVQFLIDRADEAVEKEARRKAMSKVGCSSCEDGWVWWVLTYGDGGLYGIPKKFSGPHREEPASIEVNGKLLDLNETGHYWRAGARCKRCTG